MIDFLVYSLIKEDQVLGYFIYKNDSFKFFLCDYDEIIKYFFLNEYESLMIYILKIII